MFYYSRYFEKDEFESESYIDKDNTIIEVELPGCESKDVSLTYEEKTLSLNAVASVQKEKRKTLKCWRLTQDLDIENISSKLINGLLKITIPHKKKKKPKKIEIT